MIDESSIIPYSNNWKQQTNNNIQTTSVGNSKNGEFISSLILHLDMVLNDGGNVFDELDRIIKKYEKNPFVKIDKEQILSRYNKQINE